MTNFFSREPLWTELKTLVHESQERLWMAVAYWGKGAESKLRLKQAPESFRLICDLRSGSCNPETIKSIWKKRPDSVKYLDGLHAKVYLGDSTAIVGSANASAAGTGWEGDEADYLTEAAVKIEDVQTVNVIVEWMNDLWSKAEPLDDKVLKVAIQTWNKRRRGRPTNVPIDPWKDRQIDILWEDFGSVTKKEKAAFASWKSKTGVGSDWDFFGDVSTHWIRAGSTLLFVDIGEKNYTDGVGDIFRFLPTPLDRVRVGKGDFVIPHRTGRTIKVDEMTIKLTRTVRKRIWDYVQAYTAKNPKKSWGLIPLSDVMKE